MKFKVNHILNFYDSGEFEDGEKTGSDHKKLKDNIQLCT